MGIYGALSTAVTGLRAQSFALENISGNIANSQTTGFKRIDTDFLDLIPDAPQKRQTAGSVLAQARSTNNLQGDVKGVSTETFMAINGNGFFVVEPAIGQSDGAAVFAGANYYTRRGDFELDKNGNLVNGAGYFLKGLPIDPVSQNISGSVPEVLRLDNSFLPAARTSQVNYELNLPQLPKTQKYLDSKAPGSELLSAADFMNGGLPTSTIASNGEGFSITINAGAPLAYQFTNTGANTATTFNINDPASDTIDEVLALIQADLTANAPGTTIALNATGQFVVTAPLPADTITIADTTTGLSGSGLGLPAGGTGSATSAVPPRAAVIAAEDSGNFIGQSISGGAITVYAASGAPTSVQMRWAKVDSAASGGGDVWNLYLMTDGAAVNGEPMWTKVGPDYAFGTDLKPNPPIEFTQLTGLTINGIDLGDLRLQHGTNGLTQFADANGTAEVTTLNQNGYAAGEFVSVGINDNGRVVVSYNNGEQLEVAQVVTANFNAVNQLKRMDGGVFAATSESGQPILDSDGGIIGASLEASNTDISEEFTKLIVTQQAYAAGTRIVSTADEMLQEALNMVR